MRYIIFSGLITFVVAGCGLTTDLDKLKPGPNDTSDNDTNSDIDITSDTHTDDTNGIECDTGNVNNGICCETGKTCCESGTNDIQCGSFNCDDANSYCYESCNPIGTEDDSLCKAGFHCEGSACVADVPNGGACDHDTEGSTCESGHCENGYCCASGETCCADENHCGDATQPICSNHQCVGCDVDDQCDTAYPGAPICNDITGECVECTADIDCQDGSVAPVNSLGGVCSPDNTCTCWIDPAYTSSYSCSSNSDCTTTLGTDWVCARDYLNRVHYSCLRKCSDQGDYVYGVSCEQRADAGSSNVYVWVPKDVTCFAFSQFWNTCSTNTNCSAIANPNEEAYCISTKCTFDCSDDTDCHEAGSCGTSPPFNGVCKKP